MLNEFDEMDFHGGKARKISNKVYHLMRGQIYNIAEKSIFTFGGAASHDKEARKEGKNWWAQELPSEIETDAAIRNLTSANFKADIVITHCAPTSIQNMYFPDYPANHLTDFLESIKNRLIFENWFFGHYHADIAINGNFRAVFDNIVKI